MITDEQKAEILRALEAGELGDRFNSNAPIFMKNDPVTGLSWEAIRGMNKMKTLKFKKLHPDAQLPARAKPGDAGMDITCVDAEFDLDPNNQVKYKLGLAVEIPQGYVGLLFPRSSVCKTDLSLANCVGVIDSGYRGELAAVFNKTGLNYKFYNKGDRVVQLIVIPVPEFNTEWAEELSSTERGDGGFGSTGA